MLDERVEVGLKHSITLFFIVVLARGGEGDILLRPERSQLATAARGEVRIRVLLSNVASSD